MKRRKNVSKRKIAAAIKKVSGRDRMEDVKSLESGACPHCAKSVRWDNARVLPISELQKLHEAGKLRHIGGGYFEILDSE